MGHFLDQLRFQDYGLYYKLYYIGLSSHFWGNFFYFFAAYGIVLSFLSFVYLIISKRINALLCSLLAMGLAGLADFLITIFWSRPRPFVTHHQLMTPITKGLLIDATSFPSAHTYIVFAIAASVFLYGHHKLGTALFIVAILVGVSRIGAGLHYPSDVIAGALLGLAAGIAAYLIIEKLEKNWEE